MEIIQLRNIGRLQNYVYILHDKRSNWCGVVDATEAEPVLKYIKKRGWNLQTILSTHHHNDHIGGNLALREATGCEIIGSRKGRDRIHGITKTVDEGDILKFGDVSLQCLFTPGHTKDHISFYCAKEKALFCGDTLFILGCGRVFDGSATELWASLRRFRELPKDTMIYCAHEYSATNAEFALSIDPNNPDLKAKYHQIISLRNQDQPTVPSLMGDEVKANPFMRADHLDIAHSVGMVGKSPEAIFTHLRQLKDSF